MNYYIKHLGFAIVTWFFLLVIDTIRTLFSLKEDGNARGLLGIDVTVVSDNEQLMTYISLTPYVALGLLLIVAIWLVAAWGAKSLKEKSNKK